MIAGKEKIARYFEELLEKHGDHFLSLDWKSKESQQVRFSVLLDIISFTNKQKGISLLDVGCGIGHLLDFIDEKGLMESVGIKYSGIDISPKIVDFARKKHPRSDFKTVDLINDRFDGNFDLVLSSGAFNIRMADIEAHKESVRKMLSRMYALCSCGVAVNFLANPAFYIVENTGEERYVYFSEEEVISWVRAISERFVLRRDYHPGDFAVYMLK